jgi:hypothetical protein
VRCMAAAPSHNPTAITKKVYFDISIGGQSEGEALAAHSRVQTIALLQDAAADPAAVDAFMLNTITSTGQQHRAALVRRW